MEREPMVLVKISKDEARRRWDTGRPIAAAQAYDWFDVPRRGYPFTSDDTSFATFDDMVWDSCAGGVSSFAKPDLTSEHALALAADHMWQHAGYGYLPGTESPAEGRARAAVDLAAMEQWGTEQGVTVEWSHDELTVSDHDFDPAEDYPLWACRASLGLLRWSMGGVDLGSDGHPDGHPYARVVAAEVMGDLRIQTEQVQR